MNDVVTLTKDSGKYKKGVKAWVVKLELKFGKKHVKLCFAKRHKDEKVIIRFD